MNENTYIARVRNKLTVGSVFRADKNDLREKNESPEKRVIAFYPHHVLTVNNNGFCESYLYYDLARMLARISDLE